MIRLLQRRPDRLIIEPTGLAALSGILNTLDRSGIKEAVDIQSIICVLDLTNINENLAREEVIDQVEAADILLASRGDLASKERIEAFQEWANTLFPRKQLVTPITQGRISIEILDQVSQRTSSPVQTGHSHGTDHHIEHHNHYITSDPNQSVDVNDLDPHGNETQRIITHVHQSAKTSTVGWICWKELTFDAQRISSWFRLLMHNLKVQRLKAVMHTNEGWWAFNFVGDQEEMWPSAYRKDSRLEVIIEGPLHSSSEVLTSNLRECLISSL